MATERKAPARRVEQVDDRADWFSYTTNSGDTIELPPFGTGHTFGDLMDMLDYNDGHQFVFYARKLIAQGHVDEDTAGQLRSLDAKEVGPLYQQWTEHSRINSGK